MMGPVLLITLGAIFLASYNTRYGFVDLWPILLIVAGVLHMVGRLVSREIHTTEIAGMSTCSKCRSSIFGGLLLLVLGVLLLLSRFDPSLRIGHLTWRYWPVLIILWGVAKLIDNLAARHTGEARPSMLSGGEIALVILTLFVLSAVGFKEMIQGRYPEINLNLSPFQQHFSETEELAPKPIPAGTHITINTGRGNITVHAGDVKQLRATLNKSASASNEMAAHEHMKGVSAVIEQTNDGFSLHPVNQNDSDGQVAVDLDVEVPKSVSLTASSGHGDITISGIAGSADANARSGNIEIHNAGANASAEMQSGDVRITSVSGGVRITGRGNEIELTDISGDATIDGEFFGPVRVRNVTKTIRYVSSRDNLTLVHMTGRMELDSGSIDISDLAGFAKITTHDKNIEAENVAGRLDINDSHGDIKIRDSNPPQEELNITNTSGLVDLTLPSDSAFEITAETRSGDIQSDFDEDSLKITNYADAGRASGKVGAKGPKISIVTSYGTIYLHKSS
jgi:hypothetical protein